jgi:hypothetical protein
LPDTLDELRGCLFYEQRRWHHFGEEPTGRSAEYMWALVSAIGALAVPLVPTIDPIPEPLPRTVAKTHVKLVATRAVVLRPVPGPVLRVRPLPARGGRLVAVPAAEAHVRLVSSIEDDADAVTRHPSSHASKRWGQMSGDPKEHPAGAASSPYLRPMPSADPLPKPPVIVPRSRRAVSSMPNRPGGAVNATRGSGATWPSSVTRWRFEKVNGTSSSTTAHDGASKDTAPEDPASCREFRDDEASYLAWVDTHLDGLVLNQPRSARAKAPTLHRVGCAALTRRVETGDLPTGVFRVCGPSPEALVAWSRERGTGEPIACRRCHP